MDPQHLLVFDIETVPDRDHHEGTGFPKPPFHKVVAIGFQRQSLKNPRMLFKPLGRCHPIDSQDARITDRYRPSALLQPSHR